MVQRACLVSSGTGGHLWPAVVLAEALRADGVETMLLTEGRAIERELLERVGLPAATLAVRGGGVGQLFRLAQGAWQARRILRDQGIDFVVSTGGRTSLAVGFAARSLRLPLFLLEQNAVTGRSNRLLLPLARRIYMGLPPQRRMPRSVHTGTPLRREFQVTEREAARRELGLDPAIPVVMVTGGSQGAGVLNERVPDALIALRRPLQVLHVAGPGRDDAVRVRYASGLDHDVMAVVRGVAMDMAAFYAAADLVICRGGGCTVAELIAVGRPAVIVPYPHHRDRQQFHNGKVLVDAGAARIVAEDELTGAALVAVLVELLDDLPALERMGRCAARLAPADPCGAIVADLHEQVSPN